MHRAVHLDHLPAPRGHHIVKVLQLTRKNIRRRIERIEKKRKIRLGEKVVEVRLQHSTETTEQGPVTKKMKGGMTRRRRKRKRGMTNKRERMKSQWKQTTQKKGRMVGGRMKVTRTRKRKRKKMTIIRDLERWGS
ncbi:hypothetical protein K439DRAFT_751605 [Ramaria rubella]|nr:hypothetical protein K439DRAFT_751605 [Ramaria rubella]